MVIIKHVFKSSPRQSTIIVTMSRLCYFVIVICILIYIEAVIVDYTVPKPEIKLILPQGFRISIPHERGIELFAVYGNINEPITGWEVGQFSREMKKPKRDKWVYQNNNIVLKDGDLINFWILVIKDNVAYRYRHEGFLIKDIVPSTVEPMEEIIPDFPYNHPISQSETISQIHLDLAQDVQNLSEKVKKLEETNNILVELTRKNETLSRTLVFEGTLPPYEDAVYTAQVIINEKLGLRIPVTDATRNSDRRLTFELASLNDKLEVIRTAKHMLLNSKIKLVY